MRPIFAASLLLFVACGGKDVSRDASVAGNATDAAFVDLAANDDAGPHVDASTPPASGCGKAPAHSKSYTASTTDGNGTTRSYDVQMPTTYDDTKPLALTFVYHGAGANPATAEGFGVQKAPGAADASIFVFPAGIPFETYGVGWDDLCSGRDMVLFDHILAEMEAEYCIDPQRVFVSGFSWGCDQATALTCCRGDRIRATSGGSCTDEFITPSDPTTYVNLSSCPGTLHAAIRFTHDASGADSEYPAPDFASTSKLYQTWAGCPAFSGTLTADECHTYSGCALPFVECPYTKLGHALPSGWGNDTWAFFASFP
jgi:polyhydroxybutyrate depolymerase